MDVLLIGRTGKGAICVHLADASWQTVRSVADSLQGHATEPIEWDVLWTEGEDMNACRLSAVGDEAPLLLDAP